MIWGYELRQIFIVLRPVGQKDSWWIELQNIMHLSLMLIVKSGLQKMLKQICQRNSGGNQVKVSQNQSDRRKDVKSIFYFDQSSSLHLK